MDLVDPTNQANIATPAMIQGIPSGATQKQRELATLQYELFRHVRMKITENHCFQARCDIIKV